jgi:hypothetical protein
MTASELNKRLASESVVKLTAQEWSELTGHFEEIQKHATFAAGDLLIVRDETGLIAVEQPAPDERAIRRFSSPEEAEQFVQQRLKDYERMWDGCGCKIDYYT